MDITACTREELELVAGNGLLRWIICESVVLSARPPSAERPPYVCAKARSAAMARNARS
jgi:hypothetical protein